MKCEKHTSAGVRGSGPKARCGRVALTRVIWRVRKTGPIARNIALVASEVRLRVHSRERRRRVRVRERRSGGRVAVPRDHYSHRTIAQMTAAIQSRQ